jgi:ABC-2 type transport system permease protein
VQAALRIARKDIRQRVRDRSAFLWGFLAPVGLAFIFSLVLGGAGDPDNLGIRYGVVDLDGGPAAGFVDGALRSLVDSGIVEELVPFDAEEEAEAEVDAGNLDAVFILPAGFSEAAFGEGRTAVEVVGFADSSIGTQVARAVAQGVAADFNGVRTAVATVCRLRGEDPAACATEELAAAAQEAGNPLVLGEDEAADKQLAASTFYSAGMAVMFLFLTVQFGVLGLLEEKTNGTMRRLLAAPISRGSVILGKAITSFVLGVVSMAAIVVVTSVVPTLKADWGNPLGVAVLVLAGVLAAMGVMMVVAVFARTAEQAQNLQAIVAFLLAMLGGAFFPVAQAGGWLEQLSLLTPHAWFLRGLGDLAGGEGLAGVMGSVWPILLFAAATMLVASFRLKRVVEP